jgi:hypothetical protein
VERSSSEAIIPPNEMQAGIYLMKLELQRPRQCAGYNLAVCVLASGSKGNAIYISDGKAPRTSMPFWSPMNTVTISRRSVCFPAS